MMSLPAATKKDSRHQTQCNHLQQQFDLKSPYLVKMVCAMRAARDGQSSAVGAPLSSALSIWPEAVTEISVKIGDKGTVHPPRRPSPFNDLNPDRGGSVNSSNGDSDFWDLQSDSSRSNSKIDTRTGINTATTTRPGSSRPSSAWSQSSSASNKDCFTTASRRPTAPTLVRSNIICDIYEEQMKKLSALLINSGEEMN